MEQNYVEQLAKSRQEYQEKIHQMEIRINELENENKNHQSNEKFSFKSMIFS